MYAKSYTVITSLLLIFSCHLTCGFSILNNPEVGRNILNVVLQAQGTSPEQIYDRLLEANGNEDSQIDAVNTELNENLLQKDGDSIKIRLEGLKNVLAKSVQNVSRDPRVGSVLTTIIDESFNSQNDELQEWVNDNAIPVDVLQNQIALLGESKRRKRSGVANAQLQPRFLDAILNPIGDLVGTILSPVGSLLGIILDPINSTLKNIVAGIFQQLYTIVGAIILSPVLNLVNGIIDSLIPCSTC